MVNGTVAHMLPREDGQVPYSEQDFDHSTDWRPTKRWWVYHSDHGDSQTGMTSHVTTPTKTQKSDLVQTFSNFSERAPIQTNWESDRLS